MTKNHAPPDTKNAPNDVEALEKSNTSRIAKTSQKGKAIISDILDDGTIVETIYNPVRKKTNFCLYKDGKVQRKNSIVVHGKRHYPMNGGADILTAGAVRFPSGVEEYDSFSALYAEIREFIHTYLEIPDDYEQIAAYYVMFSWVYNRFSELAYLRALGDYGSGKSRFLQVIGSLCYKPIFALGASSASPIFRLLSEVKGTLIFDEADLRFSDSASTIIKILNAGFMKNMPILRAESHNKSFHPKAFHVFGPKLIATREMFQGRATESRCFTNIMEPCLRTDIPLNLGEQFNEKVAMLQNKLLLFRFRNYHEINPQEIPRIQNIEPRLQQIVQPLLCIVPDETHRQNILTFVAQFQKQLHADRYNSREAFLLRMFIELPEEKPTIKMIVERAKCLSHGEISFSYQKAGAIIRNTFSLRSVRHEDGYRICKKQNAKQLIRQAQKWLGETLSMNS